MDSSVCSSCSLVRESPWGGRSTRVGVARPDSYEWCPLHAIVFGRGEVRFFSLSFMYYADWYRVVVLRVRLHVDNRGPSSTVSFLGDHVSRHLRERSTSLYCELRHIRRLTTVYFRLNGLGSQYRKSQAHCFPWMSWILVDRSTTRRPC